MPQQTINTPRDTTLQATNTALGLLAKDATIGATNTALGLLGKDASLQDIKAALLQIVAALDPTADDYDQLTNKPQVNGVTLSGNKTSKQLGIRQTIPLTSAQYAQLSSAEKMDVDKDYIITDENATAAPIDDDSVSRNKVWSSYKVDEELDTLNSNISDCGKLEFIKDIPASPASTTWTPDPKYKGYVARLNLSGYVFELSTRILEANADYDLLATAYYNSTTYCYIPITIRPTGTSYTFTGSNMSVYSAKLYGIL